MIWRVSAKLSITLTNVIKQKVKCTWEVPLLSKELITNIFTDETNGLMDDFFFKCAVNHKISNLNREFFIFSTIGNPAFQNGENLIINLFLCNIKRSTNKNDYLIKVLNDTFISSNGEKIYVDSIFLFSKKQRLPLEGNSPQIMLSPGRAKFVDFNFLSTVHNYSFLEEFRLNGSNDFSYECENIEVFNTKSEYMKN